MSSEQSQTVETEEVGYSAVVSIVDEVSRRLVASIVDRTREVSGSVGRDVTVDAFADHCDRRQTQ